MPRQRLSEFERALNAINAASTTDSSGNIAPRIKVLTRLAAEEPDEAILKAVYALSSLLADRNGTNWAIRSNITGAFSDLNQRALAAANPKDRAWQLHVQNLERTSSGIGLGQYPETKEWAQRILLETSHFFVVREAAEAAARRTQAEEAARLRIAQEEAERERLAAEAQRLKAEAEAAALPAISPINSTPDLRRACNEISKICQSLSFLDHLKEVHDKLQVMQDAVTAKPEIVDTASLNTLLHLLERDGLLRDEPRFMAARKTLETVNHFVFKRPSVIAHSDEPIRLLSSIESRNGVGAREELRSIVTILRTNWQTIRFAHRRRFGHQAHAPEPTSGSLVSSTYGFGRNEQRPAPGTRRPGWKGPSKT